MGTRQFIAVAGVIAAIGASGAAFAETSASEAAALGAVLTPFGAEKAANKDGSIPEWTGKTFAPAGKRGPLPADPFAAEKPLYRITAQNAQQYSDKLSDGAVALLKKYSAYAIDVYPTHRTATAPQYVYDATRANAGRASLSADGLKLSGVYAGVPFPLPKQGIEIYWNHVLRPQPVSLEYSAKNIVGSADGKSTLVSRGNTIVQFPYYYQNGSVETWNGEYATVRLEITEPPFKSGESLLVRDNINPDSARQAWQYLVGQRRVRRAPTVGYDTPDFVASGANYFDEVNGFWGDPSRFEWKLVGKKELLIPYNDNGFFNTPPEEAFVPYHTNPDKLRWELHRVWVVDATVLPGKRHAVPKRRFYFDEDTWAVAMVDGYDAEGKLWRTSQVFPIYEPANGMLITHPALVYNLQAGTYSAIQFFNGEQLNAVSPKPDRYFSSESLGESGSR